MIALTGPRTDPDVASGPEPAPQAALPGRVDRIQRDQAPAVRLVEFSQGMGQAGTHSGDSRTETHQPAVLVILTVLDAVQFDSAMATTSSGRLSCFVSFVTTI
ncbi:hypothetical protein ACFC1R_02575 [Kitasatospora sp. NPDC056138]|uniref:hypothetical protein n=1 Tax=Kitasatospora sp. NPDC056138 TaxID=3345724 RepID=UPI0035DD2C5D